MCDTIDSSNLRDFEAKYENIKSHQTLVDPQNARQFLRESFLDSLDGVVLANIYKLKNLFSLNCQRNQIYQLPNSLAQMKLLQELDVLENPLVFPPFNIVSRGLAHILAFLSRKEQKAPLHPPPLQQQQYEEEEDLVEEVAEGISSSCQNPISPPATLLSSPTASRPSSAMATVTWQKRTESSHSDRHILRRRSSQPEFYKHVATASGDTDYSSVSLTSLSEDEASAHGLHQPFYSQQLWKEEHYGQTYSSYPTISHKPQV
ncbi:Cyclic GMP-binding protein C, partial [Taenia solium]|eukprot:TsM_001184100 transcript=TsM_001184100 gene=TsM_001184100